MPLIRSAYAVILGLVLITLVVATVSWMLQPRLGGLLEDGAAESGAQLHSRGVSSGGNSDRGDRAQSVKGIAEPATGVQRTSIGIALSGDGTLAERLSRASTVFGSNDYRVRRAAMYARNLCASPDPSGSLSLPLPDPSRDWAFEAIAALCVGMDALVIDESTPVIGEPEALFLVDRSRGREAALAAARELLARESDPVLVEEAALFAWETGQSPSLASMGVNAAAIGPVEQMAAISEAVRLAACLETGGCGPMSWQAIAFCVRVGCAPGSGFHEALRANNSEQRMRLIEGYARWILSFRKG